MFFSAIKLKFSQLLEDIWSFLLNTLLLWANDTGPQMAFFRIYFYRAPEKFYPYFMYNIAILAKKNYRKNMFSNIVRTHQKCLESISNLVGHTENSEKRCQLKMIFFAHFV